MAEQEEMDQMDENPQQEADVEESEAESERPIIELYVKAGVDHLGNGGCPMCHRYFLMFYILRNQGMIDLVVTTVRPEDIPKEVKEVSSGKQFPIVRVHKGVDAAGQSISGLVYDTVPEIEELLDKFDCDDVASSKESRKEAQAELIFQDLYRKLMFFLQDQSTAGSMNSILEKIDHHLKENGTKFLLADNMSRADCYLLPSLQHLRVAGKYYKDYEIPTEYEYLWRYLHSAYEEAGVVASTPPDREIIRHYSNKSTGKPASKRPPTLLGDDRTFSTPLSKSSEVANGD